MTIKPTSDIHMSNSASHKYYLSSPKMTVLVETGTVAGVERIVRAAPIVRRFIGQPLSNLLRWMKPDIVEDLT